MRVSEKIGESLVRQGTIKEFQVKNILLRQQHGDVRKFGEIAVDLRYIPASALQDYLQHAGVPSWAEENFARKTSSFSVQSIITKSGLVG